MENNGRMGNSSSAPRVSHSIPPRTEIVSLPHALERRQVSGFRELGYCRSAPEYWKASAGNGGGVGWGHVKAFFLPRYVSRGTFPEGCEKGGKFLDVLYND